VQLYQLFGNNACFDDQRISSYDRDFLGKDFYSMCSIRHGLNLRYVQIGHWHIYNTVNSIILPSHHNRICRI